MRKAGMISLLSFVQGLFFLLFLCPGLLAQAPAQSSEILPGTEIQQAAPVQEFDVTVGYNLQVTVRLSPVYQEKSLVSPIIAYLPKNSIVAVVIEDDTWYQIAFGQNENRKTGWVIAYGMERTHEMEVIVTTREDVSRYEGRKIVVVAGESSVRSFPSQQAQLLMRVYRDEVFDVAGESKDYFMIQLSKAVRGWIWKGDVDDYIEPRYSNELTTQMKQMSGQQKERLRELDELLTDLEQQSGKIDKEIGELDVLWQKKLAELQQIKVPYFTYENLKKKSRIYLGMQRQAFAEQIGLAPAMLMGLGFGFDLTGRTRLEITRHSGKPTVRAIGSEQDPLPASMDNLDTLGVTSSLLRFGVRYAVPALKIPILGGKTHYLIGGIGRMRFTPCSRGIKDTQTLWGMYMGWGLTKPLFGKMELDLSLNYFLSSTDVTDVRYSGSALVKSKKVFVRNLGLTIGMIWDF